MLQRMELQDTAFLCRCTLGSPESTGEKKIKDTEEFQDIILTAIAKFKYYQTPSQIDKSSH
jgi:hypothetical protein